MHTILLYCSLIVVFAHVKYAIVVIFTLIKFLTNRYEAWSIKTFSSKEFKTLPYHIFFTHMIRRYRSDMYDMIV